MVVTNSPTVLKRWISFELRKLREDCGRSREEAAERIGKATSQIGHLETMRNLPAASDLEILLTWYGRPERVEFFRDLLARAKKGRDWWVGMSDLEPEWLSLFLGLESAATQVESYDAAVVSGLFQTEEYAAAIFRGGSPQISDEDLRTRVELRMSRQRLLDREEPAQVWRVIDESALRRLVGSRKIMEEQLEYLLRVAQRPNVDLQVLPSDAGAHIGMDGTFTILSFPSEFVADPGVVYVETMLRGIYYEDPQEIRTYRNALNRLRVQALGQDESREVILRVLEEL